jgi:hypothetical protein
MKKSMKISGGKIAIIVALVMLALLIIGMMYDYYSCPDTTDGCKKKFWRFWMPKEEAYRRRKSYKAKFVKRSRYNMRPPEAPMPPIPSTAGSNQIISPYVMDSIVQRNLRGVGSKRY